ncbi:MAG: signal peptidase II [Deltaproteobacteria bacterium]|nr:signal peptidase II [Deltaproteobacteria bacterium]MBF0524845.1 signal peptidase II [Deltaproteobacteria bacterium]
MLIYVAVPVLILDQVTKAIILRKLALHQSLEVIPGFFNLCYVRNKGAAFGVLNNFSPSLTRYLFIAVGVFAVVIIGCLVNTIKEDGRWMVIALGLILGGAVGNNLIDRVRWGEVIDFLDVYVKSYHWPVFNVADSAITIGSILLAYQIIRRI